MEWRYATQMKMPYSFLVSKNMEMECESDCHQYQIKIVLDGHWVTTESQFSDFDKFSSVMCKTVKSFLINLNMFKVKNQILAIKHSFNSNSHD